MVRRCANGNGKRELLLASKVRRADTTQNKMPSSRAAFKFLVPFILAQLDLDLVVLLQSVAVAIGVVESV